MPPFTRQRPQFGDQGPPLFEDSDSSSGEGRRARQPACWRPSAAAAAAPPTASRRPAPPLFEDTPSEDEWCGSIPDCSSSEDEAQQPAAAPNEARRARPSGQREEAPGRQLEQAPSRQREEALARPLRPAAAAPPATLPASPPRSFLIPRRAPAAKPATAAASVQVPAPQPAPAQPRRCNVPKPSSKQQPGPASSGIPAAAQQRQERTSSAAKPSMPTAQLGGGGGAAAAVATAPPSAAETTPAAEPVLTFEQWTATQARSQRNTRVDTPPDRHGTAAPAQRSTAAVPAAAAAAAAKPSAEQPLERAACCLHNVRGLVLGREVLIDLLSLEEALLESEAAQAAGLSVLRGALVRCQAGSSGRLGWQQIRRATCQPDGTWVLVVGQEGREHPVPATTTEPDGISSDPAQSEAELGELSVRWCQGMLSSRLQVATAQWGLRGGATMLAKIIKREGRCEDGSVPVSSAALKALLATLLNPDGVRHKLAGVVAEPAEAPQAAAPAAAAAAAGLAAVAAPARAREPAAATREDAPEAAVPLRHHHQQQQQQQQAPAARASGSASVSTAAGMEALPSGPGSHPVIQQGAARQAGEAGRPLGPPLPPAIAGFIPPSDPRRRPPAAATAPAQPSAQPALVPLAATHAASVPPAPSIATAAPTAQPPAAPARPAPCIAAPVLAPPTNSAPAPSDQPKASSAPPALPKAAPAPQPAHGPLERRRTPPSPLSPLAAAMAAALRESVDAGVACSPPGSPRGCFPPGPSSSTSSMVSIGTEGAGDDEACGGFSPKGQGLACAGSKAALLPPPLPRDRQQAQQAQQRDANSLLEGVKQDIAGLLPLLGPGASEAAASLRIQPMGGPAAPAVAAAPPPPPPLPPVVAGAGSGGPAGMAALAAAQPLKRPAPGQLPLGAGSTPGKRAKWEAPTVPPPPPSLPPPSLPPPPPPPPPQLPFGAHSSSPDNSTAVLMAEQQAGGSRSPSPCSRAQRQQQPQQAQLGPAAEHMRGGGGAGAHPAHPAASQQGCNAQAGAIREGSRQAASAQQHDVARSMSHQRSMADPFDHWDPVLLLEFRLISFLTDHPGGAPVPELARALGLPEQGGWWFSPGGLVEFALTRPHLFDMKSWRLSAAAGAMAFLDLKRSLLDLLAQVPPRVHIQWLEERLRLPPGLPSWLQRQGPPSLHRLLGMTCFADCISLAGPWVELRPIYHHQWLQDMQWCRPTLLRPRFPRMCPVPGGCFQGQACPLCHAPPREWGWQ